MACRAPPLWICPTPSQPSDLSCRVWAPLPSSTLPTPLPQHRCPSCLPLMAEQRAQWKKLLQVGITRSHSKARSTVPQAGRNTAGGPHAPKPIKREMGGNSPPSTERQFSFLIPICLIICKVRMPPPAPAPALSPGGGLPIQVWPFHNALWFLLTWVSY